MEQAFWLERWQAHQLGWHRDDVNPLLIAHWSGLGLEAGSKVFVPLCGKSLDMGYLASLGHEVLGCELSRIAAEEFFAEAGVERERLVQGDFVHHCGGAVTILEGDIFNLSRGLLKGVSGVFDRGALIALPPEMRQRYVALLRDVLGKQARTLLMTLEYDQTRIGGPPFSVSEDEVHEYFRETYRVELIFSEATTELPPRYVELGLGGADSPVHQKVWKMSPK